MIGIRMILSIMPILIISSTLLAFFYNIFVRNDYIEKIASIIRLL
jgi:hypothetical protein